MEVNNYKQTTTTRLQVIIRIIIKIAHPKNLIPMILWISMSNSQKISSCIAASSPRPMPRCLCVPGVVGTVEATEPGRGAWAWGVGSSSAPKTSNNSWRNKGKHQLHQHKTSQSGSYRISYANTVILKVGSLECVTFMLSHHEIALTPNKHGTEVYQVYQICK